MKKYRKKPLVIEAIQWDGDNWDEVANTVQSHLLFSAFDHPDGKRICCLTLEGNIYASPGDYIIRGIKGELYPCKSDIFETSYEEVLGT